ncbi:MAG: pyridoxal-phosphate dependent enzyme, partial [Acidobacteriota bacterium]
EPTFQAREVTAAEILEETGGHFVSPFDDARIIAGASTATRELLEDVPDLDLLLMPVGGGGLASGAALVTSELSPSAKVIGCEPSGADDAARSVASGKRVTCERPDTICDGLRGCLSDLTYDILQRHLEAIVTIDDTTTVRAMRFLWERMKLVVEPSGAITCAGLFGAVEAAGFSLAGRRIGVMISGGNVDLDDLPWIGN